MEALFGVVALIVIGVIATIVFAGSFSDELVKIIRALRDK